MHEFLSAEILLEFLFFFFNFIIGVTRIPRQNRTSTVEEKKTPSDSSKAVQGIRISCI